MVFCVYGRHQSVVRFFFSRSPFIIIELWLSRALGYSLLVASAVHDGESSFRPLIGTFAHSPAPYKIYSLSPRLFRFFFLALLWRSDKSRRELP